MKFPAASVSLVALSLYLPSSDGSRTIRNFSTAKSMLSVKLQGHVADPDVEASNLIRNYGCYCYQIGQKVVSPRPGFHYAGPALDPVDNLCRDMYFKQKCLEIDSAEGAYGDNNEICEPTRAFQWYVNGLGEIACGEEGQSAYGDIKRKCKMVNCELEKEFAEGVFELVINGYVQTADYKNMEDSDYEASCPNMSNGNDVELGCCGAGTARRPFNVKVRECCANGLVSSIGGC